MESAPWAAWADDLYPYALDGATIGETSPPWVYWESLLFQLREQIRLVERSVETGSAHGVFMSSNEYGKLAVAMVLTITFYTCDDPHKSLCHLLLLVPCRRNCWTRDIRISRSTLSPSGDITSWEVLAPLFDLAVLPTKATVVYPLRRIDDCPGVG